MRIVGFTVGENNQAGHTTVLLRPQISVLDASFRRVLSWFFCTKHPTDYEFHHSSVTIRIKTETDPFVHLRIKKVRPFDGKGVTLERHQQRPDVIQVDQDIRLPVDQFRLQCPGLLYGTENYPNLNILLSETFFDALMVDPVKLWNVMYDCLCCESFSERKLNDWIFKQKLRKNLNATKFFEWRMKLDELQGHVTSTAERNALEKSVDAMRRTIQHMEMQLYKKKLHYDTQSLQSVLLKREQIMAKKKGIEVDMDFEIKAECVQIVIEVLKNDLDNLLHFAELELNQSRHDLKKCEKNCDFLNNINPMYGKIQEILKTLISSAGHAFETAKARCCVENNHSLQMVVKLSSPEYKRRFLSDLKKQRQVMTSRIEKVAQELDLKKQETSAIINQIQTMRDRINAKHDEESTNVVDGGESVDSILNRIQAKVDEYSNSTLEIANLEHDILMEKKLAWGKYLQNVSIVSYDELISIAAALCVLEEMPDLKDYFEGFIYEQALTVNGENMWLKGYSCGAIFNTSHAALRVEHAMLLEYNVRNFSYNIIERMRQSTKSSILLECVVNQTHEMVQGGGDCAENYEELVSHVNAVVEHLQKSLKMKKKLRNMQEAQNQFESAERLLWKELNSTQAEQSEEFSLALKNTYNALPKQMVSYVDVRTSHFKLQARLRSLDELIRQLEENDFPADVERLKQDERHLEDLFKKALQQHGMDRKLFYEHVNELVDTCDAIHVELERNDEHRGETHGLTYGLCYKIVNHWSARVASLRTAIEQLEKVSQKIRSTFVVKIAETLDEIEKEIQSLHAREILLRERIETSQHAMAECQELYPMRAVPRNVQSGNDSHNSSTLLDKLSQAQRQLQTMPPAYKPEEIVRLKKKIKALSEMEKLQSSFRAMCLNNLILPTIDKLLVKQLRQIGSLLVTVSEDLPELDGTVKVFFSYYKDGEEINDHEKRTSTRLTSFKIASIAAVNFTILDETGVELDIISEGQRKLAFLLLFISFLYTDNCKLCIIDLSFQDWFEHGIISMMDVFKQHFPNMQFIILRNDE